MAITTRSQIFAVKEETTEGTLQALTAGTDFVKLRAGASLNNENEIIESEEVINDIGKAASLVVGENPSGSLPAYCKHSGTEGQAPELGIVYESCFGDKSIASTEYNTVAASTISVIKVDTGEGANFEEGQALLIKDGVNGYAIRNIDSISTDDLTIAFNISNAPALGVDLGKAVLYKPAATGHPTFSAYRFSSETSAAFKDAIAGCRTTSLTFDFEARALAGATAEFEGINFYYDYLVVGAGNDDFSVTDDGGAFTGSITQKTYKTPIALADEIESKLNAAGSETFTVSYSSSTGKFTVSATGSVLTLTCSAANSVFAAVGFGTSDLTGATTYTGASAISYDSPYAPVYDDLDPIVVVSNELFIGDATDNTCRKASTVSLAITTPKTQVKSICATNGVSETVILERTVSLTATLILSPYEAHIFDKSYNNTTTKVALNVGPKDNSGNYIPGKCFNLFMQSAKISQVSIEDQDGYSVVSFEAQGFITSGTKDVFINFI